MGAEFKALRIRGETIDSELIELFHSPTYPNELATRPAACMVEALDIATREADRARVSSETIEHMDSALMHLAPTGIADVYGGWISIGQALASLKGTPFEDAARRLWMKFSAACANYKGPEDAARKWGDLRGERTSYTAIFKRARDAGWINPGWTENYPARGALTFERDRRGKALPTRANIVAAIGCSDLLGVDVAFDDFRSEIVISPPGKQAWQPLTDEHAYHIALTLEQSAARFKNVPKELVRDSLGYVSAQKPIDTAKVWLVGLPKHDGTPRCERFLSEYMGADAGPFTRAISNYLWTAAAGRVMNPGCKADMVPVAVGPQGVGKSRSIEAIAPGSELFGELDFGTRDDDLPRLIVGKLIMELGELKGMRRRETDWLKAFITRTHEQWVPKYKEYARSYPRRCLFFGSTNRDDFLSDDTGNRRWLPFRVGQCDPDAIARDRDQLWSEALDLYERNGVMWQEAQRLATGEHEKYEEVDAWDTKVAEWLDAQRLFGLDADHVTTTQLLKEAMELRDKEIDRRNETRMGTVLRRLGWSPKRVYRNGRQMRVYVPNETTQST